MGQTKVCKTSTWRCIIAALLCFWISLFCYIGYANINVLQENDEIEIKSILSEEVEDDGIESVKEIKSNTINIEMQPPKETDMIQLSQICPRRDNICIKDRQWMTPYNESTFDARPSIRYCKGIICNSFHAEYDSSILDTCTSYDNISIIMLGQYYPHMFSHVWSRTVNGLWEYSILNPFISKHHHFVFEQLDYENLYNLHQLLLNPFSDHPVQHYANLLLDPIQSFNQMLINNNDYNISDYKTRNQPSNCACAKQVYFCGFSPDFQKNYPQGFVTRRYPKDGNHYTWDRVEWYKQFWYKQNEIETIDKKQDFLNQFFGETRMKNDKAMIGLIDKRKNGKWLNIEDVEKDCESMAQYHCKIIRMYEIDEAIHLLWIMDQIDILIGFHSNSIIEGGLWIKNTSTILEILPANPLPSWLNLPGSTTKWVFQRIPQRHAWFQLFQHENGHNEAFNAGKSNFHIKFDDLNYMISFLINNPNKYCYQHDHDMTFSTDLKNRNFTIDIKKFDEDGVMSQYIPKCDKNRKSVIS